MALSDIDRALLDAWGSTQHNPRQRARLMAASGLTPEEQDARLDELAHDRDAIEYAPGACRLLRAVRDRSA